MRETHGFDLIQPYRDEDELKHIPVVVLSVTEDPKLMAHAFAVGANDYIVKLPNPLELIARIRYHAGGTAHACSATKPSGCCA